MSTDDEWTFIETKKGYSIYMSGSDGKRRFDPPEWSAICQQVLQCNRIWDDKYRIAAKLFILQRELMWGHVRLDVLTRVWEHHGLRRDDNLMLLSATTLRAVIEDALYATSRGAEMPPDAPLINEQLGAELTSCLLWQLFDRERTGGTLTLVRAKVVLALLCQARPQDVCHALASEAANYDGQVSVRRMRPVLDALLSLQSALGEASQLVAPQDEMLEVLLRDCFPQERLRDQAAVEGWLAGPDSPLIAWLRHLARMRASDQVVYRGPCTVCKRQGLRGQVFRCQRCVWYWVCQRCFLAGRYTLNHRLEHPVVDFITPVVGAAEKCQALTRGVKAALTPCVIYGIPPHHYPTEPLLTRVPPVKTATPTPEMRYLSQCSKNIIAQLEREKETLQRAAAKWQSPTEASTALLQYGFRLQMIGSQISQLWDQPPGAQPPPESTPLQSQRRKAGAGFVPRLMELSPIVAAKSVAEPSGATPEPTEGQESRAVSPLASSSNLELSTILHQRGSVVNSLTHNTLANLPLPELPAGVAATLSTLQALLHSNSAPDESFSSRDNEQLAQAAREFEQVLADLIASIETANKTPEHG